MRTREQGLALDRKIRTVFLVVVTGLLGYWVGTATSHEGLTGNDLEAACDVLWQGAYATGTDSVTHPDDPLAFNGSSCSLTVDRVRRTVDEYKYPGL